MGVLRKKGCYRTKARIYRDSNVEVTLRWFIVPDGTPFLPVPHLWGGRPWRYDQTPPTNGPGELTQSPLQWDKGLPPARPGPWIGADDWWKNGVPYKERQSPNIIIRPGVCPPLCNDTADTGCDICPESRTAWEMGAFESFAGLSPAPLLKDIGCVWSCAGLKDVPGCSEGCSPGWIVQLIEPIPGLTSAIMTQESANTFAAGCCSADGGI